MSPSSVILEQRRILFLPPDMLTSSNPTGSTITTRRDSRGNIVALPAPKLQGKQTTRSATFKSTKLSPNSPPPSPAITTGTPLPTLPASTIASAGDYSGFSSDVMRMIGQMPEGANKTQIMSAFSQIQALPPDQQKAWFDSLMTQASTATAPQAKQDQTRSDQSYAYTQGNIKQAEDFANANYQRLLGQTDFNALRAKAQDNKTLSDALQSVTSDSFVTNVAGSGIVARRAEQQRYAAAQQAQDKDIATQQSEANSQAQLEQYQAGQQGQMDRSKQEQADTNTDLAQQNLYNTQSLFLDLFKNETTDTGQQVQNNIGASVAPDQSGSTPAPQTFQDTTQKAMPGSTFAQRTAARAALRSK